MNDSLVKDRAWIDIDLDSLNNNVDEIRRVCPNCRIAAVVKANAYGLGSKVIAKYLEDFCNIDYFIVATIHEGLILRKNGILGEILILGITNPIHTNELISYNLIQTVNSVGYSEVLNSSASGDKQLKVHIAIDTGMGRLGLSTEDIDSTVQSIIKISKFTHLDIDGAYTHLATADSSIKSESDFTSQQITKVKKIMNTSLNNNVSIKNVHYCNSAGSLYYYDPSFPVIRPGIILYGIKPDPSLNLPIHLEGSFLLRSRVVQIKSMFKGSSIGYGRSIFLDRDSLIAVIAIGYADGVDRRLSNNGFVLIDDKEAPIVGKICMDYMMVDITDISDVKIGDVVTIMSCIDNSIDVDCIASRIGTISYELISHLSHRLPRVYYSNGVVYQIES